MVGLGVDFADAPQYVGRQRPRHRHAPRRAARPGFAGRIVLASSMVVYGEGAYTLPPSTARSDRRPAGRPISTPGASSPRCPRCGRPARPAGRHRGRRARPPQRLRRHEAAPGAPLRRLRARARQSRDRPALPQRLRATDATRHPLRRRGVHLPLGRGSGERAPGVRGRRPAPRLRPRPRRGPGQPLRPRRAGRVGGAFNVASGEPRTILDVAVAMTATGSASSRRWSAATASATCATSSPRPNGPDAGWAFEATVPFAAGMRDFTTAPLRS